jgi:hypothetical protein
MPSSAAKVMDKRTDAKSAIKGLLSAQYDTNANYQFMDSFRNHVQHAGLPVHGIEFGASWVGEPGSASIEYSLKITALKNTLAENSEFKTSVLERLPDEVNLALAMRSYLESLSNVQCEVRTMMQEALTLSRATIKNAIDEYRRLSQSTLIGLSAIKEEDGVWIALFPLFLDYDDIRINLANRNQRLINLHLRRATNQSSKP